jgi:hypothetical protein
MIVMDRENLWARGWSHVLSTTNDITELREFCARVGAPASALHRGRWPHLDLKLLPRDRALACPDVRVFERTSDMLRFVKGTPDFAERMSKRSSLPHQVHSQDP